MENSLAHQNGGTTNPCPSNDTAFLLCPSYKSTRTSHLYSLGDALTKSPARLFLVVSQQPAECAVGASSSGIFRNAAQWSKHAGADIKAVVHPAIQMRLRIDPQIAKRLEPAQIDAGAFECRAISQFREHERKTDRTNLRMMRFRHDVLAVERDGRRDQLCRHVFPERELRTVSVTTIARAREGIRTNSDTGTA